MSKSSKQYNISFVPLLLMLLLGDISFQKLESLATKQEDPIAVATTIDINKKNHLPDALFLEQQYSNVINSITYKKQAKPSIKKIQKKRKPYFSNVNLSKKDYKALEKIVQAEAGGEDEQGKILVAQVVLNRVKHKEFASTVYKVIFEKLGGSAQFSPTIDGRYETVKITKETKKAVKKALSGKDISKGALYFSARDHASEKNMLWFDSNLTWLFQHGGHEFYTLP